MGARGQLSSSLRALREVIADRQLRRYVLPVTALGIVEYACGLVLWLYVLARGGPAAISWLVAIGYGVAAVLAPPAGAIADRYGRGETAVAACLLRALAFVAIALSVLGHWPLAITLVLAGLEAALYALGAPALWALAPTLVRRPAELSALNLTLTMATSLAVTIGPLVSGAGYAAIGAGPALIAGAGAFAVTTIPLVGVVRQVRRQAIPAAEDEETVRGGSGLRAAAATPGVRTLLSLFCGYYFAVGVVDVLLIVFARRVLHIGQGETVTLYAALGAGGIIAGLGSGGLAGAALGRSFAGSVLLWSVPIAVLATLSSFPAVLLLVALAGAAGTFVQASGYTLLQRVAPEAMVSRVLGLYETATGLAYVVAAVLLALLVPIMGVRALLLVGVAVASASALALLAPLRRIDRTTGRQDERLALLERVPWLASGGLAQRSHVAARMRELEVTAGQVVVYQGEIGLAFYVIAGGACRVFVDGRAVRELGRGASFGEIALLYDVPRSATVQAIEPTSLLVLSDRAFRQALAGAGDTTRRLGHGAIGTTTTVWPRRDVFAGEAPATPGRVDDVDERERVLGRTALLAAADPASLRGIATGARIRLIGAGETLIRAGEAAETAYLAWAGRLQVEIDGQTVREAIPGQLVGEFGALHGVERTATVVALEPATVLEIDGATLRAAVTPAV